MLFLLRLVIKLQQNHGEQVVLFPVFPVFLEVELTVLAKQHLEICAEVDECSLPPRFGEDGTDVSTKDKEDMPVALPLLPPPSLHW